MQPQRSTAFSSPPLNGDPAYMRLVQEKLDNKMLETGANWGAVSYMIHSFIAHST